MNAHYPLKKKAAKQAAVPARVGSLCGVLNEIAYDGCAFRLLMADKSRVDGRLDAEFGQAELRAFWGMEVVVEGRVHFKANGKPRRIEANKIVLQCDADAADAEGLYAEDDGPNSPAAKARGAAAWNRLPPEVRAKARAFDPTVLRGLWPDNDESLEELLADLD